jgi:hypothetical protein
VSTTGYGSNTGCFVRDVAGDGSNTDRFAGFRIVAGDGSNIDRLATPRVMTTAMATVLEQPLL